MALVAPNQFKKQCALCGKYGHKRENCFENKNNNNRRQNKNYNGRNKDYKTITGIQDISKATMEHQDTPIIFSAIFAKKKDTQNLFATSNSKTKNNPNKDKKKMWC